MKQDEMVLPPKKMTHCDRLLNALLKGTKINPLMSWTHLGIYRLASRIHDLRSGKHDGVRYVILSDWHDALNQWGEKVTVSEYYISLGNCENWNQRRHYARRQLLRKSNGQD